MDTDEHTDLQLKSLPSVLDGRYFQVIENADEGSKITAKCLLCTKYRTIMGSAKATSNFVTHLKRVHKNEYQGYESQKKVETAGTSAKKRKPMKQAKLNFMITQSDADELIVNLISSALLPLHIVANEDFKKLIAGLAPHIKVMSPKTLQTRLLASSQASKQKLVEEIGKVEYVCLTADIWSDRSRSFMGMTAHWIDDKLERKSVALTCQRFRSPHTFDRIADIIVQTMRNYKLGLDKVVCIVTDNGSNFVKAFKEFEVDTTAKDSDEDEMDDEAMDSTVDLDLNSIFSDSSSCKLRLPCHQRCAAHTLSLVASNDPLKLITVGPAAEFKKIQRSTMAKCSSLWNKSSKPKAGESIQEICGIQLVVPCVTRWNSLYDSVSCLMRPTVKSNLDKICDAVIIPKFKPAELEFLEEYQKVLAPIAQALDRLQGETFMGMLAPAIHSVKIKLMKLEEGGTIKFCRPLVTGLLGALETRFENLLLLNQATKTEILAAVSHPQFKLKWVPTDKYEEVKNMLLEEASLIGKRLGDQSRSTLENTDKADDFFVFPSEPRDSHSDINQPNDKVHLECLQYLSDQNSEISMLERYPTVRAIFVHFNTAIPTSAPVERLFSFAGMILTPKRKRLSDTNFEHLVLRKCSKIK